MDPAKNVATFENTDKNLLNELWEILPYAGLWKTGVDGLINNFPVPPEKKSYLLGIPYPRGTSESVDPTLRLVNFGPEKTNGPIERSGLQTFFFDSYLNHQIKWEICPLKEHVGDVSIGFYSPQFLAEGVVQGKNVCLPMITNAIECDCSCELGHKESGCRCKESGGPAFYMTTHANRRGFFEITQYDSLYVVVNSSDVSVRLWVSYTVPKPFVIPTFRRRFVVHKYFVGGEGCEILAATEQLVSRRRFKQTLLRPANKFIDLALAMIALLRSRQVTISLFNRSATGQTQSYPVIPFAPLGDEPCIPIPPSTICIEDDLTFTYFTETRGLVGATCQGNGTEFQALTIDSETSQTLTAIGTLNISLPPLEPGEQDYTSDFSIALMQISDGRPSFIADPINPLTITLHPGETFNEKLTFVTDACLKNCCWQLEEEVTLVGQALTPSAIANFRKVRSSKKPIEGGLLRSALPAGWRNIDFTLGSPPIIS